MNAEAILEAVKAFAKNRVKETKMCHAYDRGERRVALDILTLIKGLERKENDRKTITRYGNRN